MPYVMVPVPEEHVEAVMQFILRSLARASMDDWDSDSIGEMWHDVDEACRSVLAFVARASLGGAELDVNEVARKLQLTPRETAAVVNELNNVAREANRPAFILMRNVTAALPNGRVTEKRVLQMESDVAQLVNDAEQAELREAPHPLSGVPE
jgi:hypothetical protein